MKTTYYSNGKLLLSAEYLVLDGAKALAVPTRYGQSLIVEPGPKELISWISYDQDDSVWFEATLTFDQIKNNAQSDSEIQNTLTKMLYQASIEQPNFLQSTEGYTITTHLTFPRKWGLGTSSTLINNIAQWLQIDAYQLLQSSFGGSGYDIACAQNDSPITYQLASGIPKVEPVAFNPSFTDCLYFVYLNKKQNSKTAIENYKNQAATTINTDISTVNKLTTSLLHAKTLEAFSVAVRAHEKLMSEILQTETVKERLFPDFIGEIKSLGAWGGDFVMVVSEINPKTYFRSKGYDTLLKYEELILVR